MQYRQKAGLALFLMLSALGIVQIGQAAPAYAAPTRQADPAAQCIKGIQLFNEGKAAEALPLLEAGFTNREGATFDSPDDPGMCALGLGLLRDRAGDRSGALAAYMVALEIFHTTDNRAFQGATLSNIGQIYDNQGHYAEALDAFQQALKLRQAAGDRPGAGASRNDIGLVYEHLGRYAEALDAFQQALKLRQEVGDRPREGLTRSNIGTVYEHLGRYAEALSAYQQALAISHEVGDQRAEGIALNNIGAIYNNQGRYTEALDSYQQALVISRASGDRYAEGTALNNFGAADYYQGRYTEALDNYQQALAIRRELSDQAGEASTITNLGAVYNNQGRYAEALDSYQQALAINREIGDQAGEGLVFGNIGGIYQLQGRYAEALDSYQHALRIAHEAGIRSSEGVILSSIGGVYYYQGRYAEAQETLQQALAIRREIGDRAGEAATLTNLGAAYDSQGRYAEALGSYQQALMIQREVGDRTGQGTTLDNIGGIDQEQGRYAEALDAAGQALTILREIGDRAGEGQALSNIAFAYERQGDAAQALTHYTQAMDILEAVRAEAGSEQGRAGFIAEYADLYQHAALLYHQRGEDDSAFLVSERGRARAFLDSLATGHVQLSDQASASLLDHEREAYVERQVGQNALARARAQSPSEPALIAELEKQLATAEQAHSEALAAIAQRGDQLAALVPGRTTAVLDRVSAQQQLDRQTTLLAYFVGEDQTLAFVLTRDRFTTLALPIGRIALRDQVRALLDDPSFQQQAHPSEARALYTALIVPLKPYLTSPHLTIIPHDSLHYLPWAALSDGNHYLSDDYVLSTLPSASVLPFIQANTGHPLTAPLVLGNPDGTLRFAEQEARAVARLYSVQPLIGGQATKDVLRQRVGAAGMVHLATHATFDPNVPLASSITLAPTITSSVQLDAREVYALDLHRADLVVLSACQTSLGDVSAGDEVVGLTRAFFFAGTPTVVSSLWNVDDGATALLMERFYTHLHAGVGKAAALQQAQIDVRAQYPAPYYWAGFVLAGDAGTLPTKPHWIPIVISSGALVVMLGLAWLLNVLHRHANKCASARASPSVLQLAGIR